MYYWQNRIIYKTLDCAGLSFRLNERKVHFIQWDAFACLALCSKSALLASPEEMSGSLLARKGHIIPPLKVNFDLHLPGCTERGLSKCSTLQEKKKGKKNQPNLLPPHGGDVKITSKLAGDQAAICPSAQFHEALTPASAIPEDAHWFCIITIKHPVAHC